MTYQSRGRSTIELILAVAFVGFLAGFIIVLCIGNYLRAKRAQERQRERRLARLSDNANVANGINREGGGMDSPRSHRSFETMSAYSERMEQQNLIGRQHQQNARNGNEYGQNLAYRTQQLNSQSRRRKEQLLATHEEGNLLYLDDDENGDSWKEGASSDVMSV